MPDSQTDINAALDRIRKLVPEVDENAALAWIGSVGPKVIFEATDTDILDVMCAF